jgi:hypothetical protein
MEDLKRRIKEAHLDRRILAARLKMPYGTLNCKLSGFSAFTGNQLMELLQIVEASEKIKAAIENANSDIPYFQR